MFDNLEENSKGNTMAFTNKSLKFQIDFGKKGILRFLINGGGVCLLISQVFSDPPGAY